eukprot:CAMPEP_0119101140 /NCGR_PEP_ID=MMETSP1180-20130426/262_1 /TAXON_ID=3052 ORGANISM="Chlamydomonas cf sp, Strain CCMP681" /NCGR_SAMPLE_ID=MMETSP1180 /ASSEMBLY_ACC=CAM_ASM_000741 /LENGTH=245 /DNA_ID=CAMNT_0007085203 /DNA_START=82 /DNA_END=819 /DNA_ORIENTATION=-
MSAQTLTVKATETPRRIVPSSTTQSVTPKACVTLGSLGPGFSRDNVAVAGTSTIKVKRGKCATSLAFSDATLKDVKTMKDLVAPVDYKLPQPLTLNGKFDLGTKKWTGGATLDRTIANKPVMLKLFFSNKDNLVAGETTLAVAKGQKANLTFNQKNLLAAKYTFITGDFTAEPSYNFLKSAPAVAVSRKCSTKDIAKVSYDFKSESAALEWNHKPFKAVLSSSVSKQLSVGKPSVALTYESILEF